MRFFPQSGFRYRIRGHRAVARTKPGAPSSAPGSSRVVVQVRHVPRAGVFVPRVVRQRIRREGGWTPRRRSGFEPRAAFVWFFLIRQQRRLRAPHAQRLGRRERQRRRRPSPVARGRGEQTRASGPPRRRPCPPAPRGASCRPPSGAPRRRARREASRGAPRRPAPRSRRGTRRPRRSAWPAAERARTRAGSRMRFAPRPTKRRGPASRDVAFPPLAGPTPRVSAARPLRRSFPGRASRLPVRPASAALERACARSRGAQPGRASRRRRRRRTRRRRRRRPRRALTRRRTRRSRPDRRRRAAGYRGAGGTASGASATGTASARRRGCRRPSPPRRRAACGCADDAGRACSDT